ncbi:MAG: NAD(+) diphosphatase [Longimicrobiales bacterium]|nr:NAD(+) diphosphatase [Longimicrobiales bacterium]
MYLILRQGEVLCHDAGGLYLGPAPPPGAVDPHGGVLHLSGEEGAPRVLVLEEDAAPPPGTVLRPLRGALPLLEATQARWAGRARQLLEWRDQHRFCGRCGAGTRLAPAGDALHCPRCGLSHFPRHAPAVIVLVHDEERFLLGRSPHFPGRMYSTLAGFVEPGESAEEAVHREILEEAGVRVADLRYFGSQSWPFPHSLMLGFHARWAGGEARPDEAELEDVRWFTRRDLPELPPPLSIARRLIEAFLAGAEPRAGDAP